MNELRDRLAELMGDWLDSEEVIATEIIHEVKDPEPREESTLHTRMAKAAMEVYFNTMVSTKNKK